MGHSKYIKQITGTSISQTATMICETSITEPETNETSINKSIIVEVKNFNNENEITGTALDYTIVPTTTDGSILPDYYCLNSSGTEIANTLTGTGEITGELGCLEQETDTYTICFINVGDKNITQNISINTNANQQI